MSDKATLDKAAQVIAAAVREAYSAQPGAMPIAGIRVFPLQVLVAGDTSGQTYRVPVLPGNDGSVSFGAPLSGVVAARGAGGVCARDTERIADAVTRGAMPSSRAAYWAACAAAGRSVDVLDQLVGAVVVAAAGAPSEPDDYSRLFGAPGARQADDDGPEYTAMFGTVEAGQRTTDAREVAAKAAVAALTDDEVYERMFGSGTSRKPETVPVAASAASGNDTQRPKYRVAIPRVNVRVLTASAGSAETWETVELRAGDLLPVNTHPDDVDRLSHQMSKVGPAIRTT
jgi:hypothetical protein